MKCSQFPAASVKGRAGACDNLAAMLGPKNLGRLVACAAHTLWGVSMIFMVEPPMAIYMLSMAIPWPNCECILPTVVYGARKLRLARKAGRTLMTVQ